MFPKKIKPIITGTLCASVIILAGCSTINPYTGEKQTAKSTTGALIGATAGALLGYATADKEKRKERALKGAGIGAITGGGVGYYMDVQEAKLKEKLAGSGVSVTRNGDDIMLNMPSNITFASGSASLSPEFYSALDGVVMVLNEYESTLVTVEGHTDNTGSDDFNLHLSEKRAVAVAEYLRNKGIVEERLAATGSGESKPVTDNNTEATRAQNRRVEVSISPITE
ncbi:MAG: OmpA family protein [Gammaproteobacteria bacterium]|nr:OmpA family protein [Gammaproteobacteria bacterium]